ncbi:MAG TPA: zinc-binding dehydrogenase [Anaerovoracaceae bacterium]|nr:zinc-binding dehydrogenase [Anaerovoracaceae bacterium]
MDIKKVKFGVLVLKGAAEVHEMELPPLGDDEILIRQLVCNICTADYTQWMGLRENQGYPASLGHEGAGIVIEKGKNVRNLEVDDFVALANNYCGKCVNCRQGRETECLVRKSYDEHGEYFGRMGLAEYFIRPETSVIKMNPALSPSEAAFLEPVATVVKGIKKLNIKPFEKIVVIGGGTMGQINAQAARSYGGAVIISETMENKLAVAKSLGFDTVNPAETDPVQEVMRLTGGTGADAVIVAVGSTVANQQAAKMLKKMDGRMLMFAAAYPAPEIGITANDVHYRRMEIVGTYLADLRDFLEGADLLNKKIIDVSPLIEDRKYYLDEIQEAFKEAATPGKFRVSVLLHREGEK